MNKPSLALAAAMILMAGAGLSACDQATYNYPEENTGTGAPRMTNDKRETVFGSEGLFGSGKGKDKDQGGSALGVNSFLWRASLDTLGFLPIVNADPFGGTIITDWYQLPEAPDTRFKLNVFIIDRALRADGLKVSIFKQVRDGSGQWNDTKVDPKMTADMENSILTRARQLRIVSE